MNLHKSSRPAQPDDHVIKKYQDLYDVAYLKLPHEDWEDICRLLNVDDATMVDLKRSSAYNSDKHTFCVWDFFVVGIATWERLVRAMASDPLNQVVLAKETAWDRNIDYYNVMNFKKPTHPAQPDDHVIKKYQDLYDVAYLKLPHEDWEDICRLLDVDDTTMVDLRRSSAYNSDKHTFCVRDFFVVGIATWERLVHAMASDPLNRVVLAKETAWDHNVDYYKVMNFKNPTHPGQPDDHVIKKYQELYDVAYFKLPHENWEDICRLLDVDDATIVDLKRSSAYTHDKHTFCLRDFFIVGIATWERLVRAMASDPLNRVVLAKETAWDHNIDYYKVMNFKKPTHPGQPDDHVIKKYQDLYDVAYFKLPHEDWEDICRLLDVDDATMVDLKRSSAYTHDKHTFCLRDFFNIDVATWERLVRAMASEPLNQVVLGKEIAQKYGFDFKAALIARHSKTEL